MIFISEQVSHCVNVKRRRQLQIIDYYGRSSNVMWMTSNLKMHGESDTTQIYIEYGLMRKVSPTAVDIFYFYRYIHIIYNRF